jgi:hypothetical protein
MTPGNRRVGIARSLVDIDGMPNVVPVPSASPPPSRVLSALRAGAGIALVAGVSVGAAWALRRHVMTSSRFALAEVNVVGNETRPVPAVVAESGLAIGVNIFAADLDAARARILADPWVSEASLMRRLPRTISIVVTERKAAALVVLGDTYLASADGEPFKKIEVNDPVDLPVITGLRPETLADDRLETIRTIRRAIDLALEFEHGELAKRAPSRSARRTGRHLHACGGSCCPAARARRAAVSAQAGPSRSRRCRARSAGRFSGGDHARQRRTA